jgi:hypothetical protein
MRVPSGTLKEVKTLQRLNLEHNNIGNFTIYFLSHLNYIVVRMERITILGID